MSDFLLQFIFKGIVEHTQSHHLSTEYVLPWNCKWFDVCKYIESVKGSSYCVCYYLSGEMRDIHSVPGITLGIKNIIINPSYLGHPIYRHSNCTAPAKINSSPGQLWIDF